MMPCIRRIPCLLALLLVSCSPQGADNSNVLIVTEANFDKEVLHPKGPVLVDYWAPWCGPCHRLAPAVEEVARTRAGKLRVAKVNVEDYPGLAKQNNVQTIPMMILYRQGKEMARQGGVPAREVSAWLNEWLDEELAE
jgi:thioredoxin